MEIVDSCLDILHEIDSTLNLKYNKYYIGLTNQFGVNNFVVFRAKKQHVLVNAYGLNKSEIQTWHEKMGETKLSLLSDDSDGNPRFRIFSKEDLDQYRDPIKELFAACYQGTK